MHKSIKVTLFGIDSLTMVQIAQANEQHTGMEMATTQA